jgi:hypothetical protein
MPAATVHRLVEHINKVEVVAVEPASVVIHLLLDLALLVTVV